MLRYEKAHSCRNCGILLLRWPAAAAAGASYNRSQNPARGILNQHMKVLDHTIQKYWDKFILTDSQECVKNQIQIIF